MKMNFFTFLSNQIPLPLSSFDRKIPLNLGPRNTITEGRRMEGLMVAVLTGGVLSIIFIIIRYIADSYERDWVKDRTGGYINNSSGFKYALERDMKNQTANKILGYTNYLGKPHSNILSLIALGEWKMLRKVVSYARQNGMTCDKEHTLEIIGHIYDYRSVTKLKILLPVLRTMGLKLDTWLYHTIITEGSECLVPLLIMHGFALKKYTSSPTEDWEKQIVSNKLVNSYWTDPFRTWKGILLKHWPSNLAKASLLSAQPKIVQDIVHFIMLWRVMRQDRYPGLPRHKEFEDRLQRLMLDVHTVGEVNNK